LGLNVSKYSAHSCMAQSAGTYTWGMCDA